MSDYVGPNTPSVAAGTNESVTIVAFDLGTCDGVHPAYMRVAWYFPEEGQSFDPSQSENACNYFSP
jgi:hypothetical protein